jgi:hypothetical protein
MTTKKWQVAWYAVPTAGILTILVVALDVRRAADARFNCQGFTDASDGITFNYAFFCVGPFVALGACVAALLTVAASRWNRSVTLVLAAAVIASYLAAVWIGFDHLNHLAINDPTLCSPAGSP